MFVLFAQFLGVFGVGLVIGLNVGLVNKLINSIHI